VLVTQRITFSKLKGGYYCGLAELLFQKGEKRWIVFGKKTEMRVSDGRWGF